MSDNYDQALAALNIEEGKALETIVKTKETLQKHDIVDENGKLKMWNNYVSSNNPVTNTIGSYRAYKRLAQAFGIGALLTMLTAGNYAIKKPSLPASMQEVQTEKREMYKLVDKLTLSRDFVATRQDIDGDASNATIDTQKYQRILEEKIKNFRAYE